MPKQSARQILAEAGPAVVAVLEEAKAARFRAKTMLLPSPEQVRKAIEQVPAGASKPVRDICVDLAAATGADITCPAATRKYWRLLAHAAEEDRAEGMRNDLPWWRITRDGAPNSTLPGGIERHRALLKNEGIVI